MHCDRIYVFLAEIKYLKGTKLVKFSEVRQSKSDPETLSGSVPEDSVEVQFLDIQRGDKPILFDIESPSPTPSAQGGSMLDGMDGHGDTEFADRFFLHRQALQVYRDALVEITLSLQIWNVDERILRDEEHRQRPVSDHQVLQERRLLRGDMTSADHMQFLSSCYRGHSQLLKHRNLIIYSRGGDKIALHDVGAKVIEVKKYKVEPDT